MTKRTNLSYEFNGFRFYPDERTLLRIVDNYSFRLMPKANSLLFMLIKHRGEVVTYDEMKKEVWAEAPYVLTHTIRETKHALTKVLGENAGNLETITGKGYRLNIDRIEEHLESATDDHEMPPIYLPPVRLDSRGC